jgi:hemerythrin-like domain-containing protein
MRAKKIIEQEHRSLGAVLHGLLFVVRDIRFGGKPDFELLAAMVHYIETFSERFHHPKEDAYLFARLAPRCPASAPLLARLADEHRTGIAMLRELRAALDAFHDDGEAFAAFAALTATYASFHWQHMRAEEDELMPLAQTYLTAEDWQVIDTAFSGHSDPLFGVQRGDEFKELFRRIVELAPAPLGKARG